MNSKYFAPFVLTVSAMLFGFVFFYAVLGPASDDAPVAREDSAPTPGAAVDLGALPAAVPAAIPGVPPAEVSPQS